MKKLLLALALLLTPNFAWAQCTGIFPAQNVCGSAAGGVPGPLPTSGFALAPGGVSGNVQFNNGSGGLGGYTNAQLTALLNAFTTTLSGAAPASGGGTVNFLRADGTWAAPPGGTVGPGTTVVGHVVTWNNTVGTLLADGGTLRTQLSGARTYYVRVSGSDTNCTGLTNVDDPGSGAIPRACAFATPQKSADIVLNTLDLNGFNVTADITGTFTTGFICGAPLVGSGVFTLTSTAGAAINTTSANAVTAANACSLTVGGNLTLTTAVSGIGLYAYAGGVILFSNVTFGAAVTTQIQAGSVTTDSGVGTITATGSYTITGGSIGHIHATVDGSTIRLASGITITITGTPAFSGFFAGITKGFIFASGVTFSGSATGPRYLIHRSGVLVGPASRTALPGNTAGTVASGGVYSVDDTDNDLGAGYVINAPTTVNALQACAAGTKGAHAFVTDNNTTLAFAGVITTGGTIQTPVYCDGTVWRQG